MSFSDHGSELTIGAAGAEDGGDYLCSLMLPSNKQSVTHKVVIKGKIQRYIYFIQSMALWYSRALDQLKFSKSFSSSTLRRKLLQTFKLSFDCF